MMGGKTVLYQSSVFSSILCLLKRMLVVIQGPSDQRNAVLSVVTFTGRFL